MLSSPDSVHPVCLRPLLRQLLDWDLRRVTEITPGTEWRASELPEGRAVY
jgi:hypothetical protein